MKINYRHNVMDIDSVTTFARIKGGYHSGCRDVYFVRLLGGNENLKNEIIHVDSTLSELMNSNKLLYKRITKLPLFLKDDESKYYIQCYDNWIANNKKKMVVHITENNEEFAEVFGKAIVEICDKYEKLKKGVSESIRKNFVVKMIWWTEYIFHNWHIKWNEYICIKVITENVSKPQEYLFYYLLTLIGADVLMLQSKEDINICDDLKKMSKEKILGDFVEWSLPEFQYCNNKNIDKSSVGSFDRKNIDKPIIDSKSINSEKKHEKIVVHIPERKRQIHNANAAQNINTTRNANAAQNINTTRNANAAQNINTTHNANAAQNINTTHNTNVTHSTISTPQSNSVLVRGTSNGVSATKHRKEKSFEELALLAASIVMIEVHNQMGDVLGIGSGIMIGKEGYILTNHHVVNKGWYYCVRIENDDEVYRTNEVIKYNSVMDLAVIRIAKTLSPLPVYKGRNKLVRGQKVVAIGSPLGLFNSVSDGIISGFRIMDNIDVIQFTAPISHGSSGGALLNMYGEVIGISSAGISSGQNINLAVPYDCINLFIQGFY